MTFYLVGLDLGGPEDGYASAEAALRLLQARRVSARIWLCSVEAGRSARVFALLRQCLRAGDGMIVEAVPPGLRLPDMLRLAA